MIPQEPDLLNPNPPHPVHRPVRHPALKGILPWLANLLTPDDKDPIRNRGPSFTRKAWRKKQRRRRMHRLSRRINRR